MIFRKLLVLFLKQLDYGSAVAVRLTKFTGKSRQGVHPKHFLTEKPWFTRYLRKKDLIVDLGCGNGQNSIKAAKSVRKIIAIEKNNDLLNIAKKAASEIGIRNIKFLSGDLEKKIEIQSTSVDGIMLIDVLEHLHNRGQILSEIYRVLKKDGFLFIGVPNSNTSWKNLQRTVGFNSFSDPDHKTEYTELSIRSLLKKNGFYIENFSYGTYDTPLRGLMDIVGGFSISLYKIFWSIRRDLVKKYKHEASGFEIVAKKFPSPS